MGYETFFGNLFWKITIMAYMQKRCLAQYISNSGSQNYFDETRVIYKII